MSGDLKAIEFVTERLEGKPRQALHIRRTSPSAEELRARLASLVEANPAIPDQLASLGRRHITATVLPVASESHSEVVEGRGREDDYGAT